MELNLEAADLPNRSRFGQPVEDVEFRALRIDLEKAQVPAGNDDGEVPEWNLDSI